MKLIKRLLSKTFVGHFVLMCKAIYRYFKDYDNVAEFFYSDELKKLLYNYLHTDFKKDWIGRLYGVVNPSIDEKGNFNVNNMIIELDHNETNNEEHVKVWTYRQLNLVGDLFKIHDLYHYISLDFEHVGPKGYDNYLLIFDLISRQEMTKSIKVFLKHLICLGIIVLTAWYIIVNWFPNLILL